MNSDWSRVTAILMSGGQQRLNLRHALLDAH